MLKVDLSPTPGTCPRPPWGFLSPTAQDRRTLRKKTGAGKKQAVYVNCSWVNPKLIKSFFLPCRACHSTCVCPTLIPSTARQLWESSLPWMPTPPLQEYPYIFCAHLVFYPIDSSSLCKQSWVLLRSHHSMPLSLLNDFIFRYTSVSCQMEVLGTKLLSSGRWASDFNH